jgi:hypothetical protein
MGFSEQTACRTNYILCHRQNICPGYQALNFYFSNRAPLSTMPLESA